MDYGSRNLEKRKKSISSKKAMQKKRVGVRFFKALILCTLLIMLIGAGTAGLFIKRIIDNSPSITPDDVKPNDLTTFVVAEDGTVLEKFFKSGSNRVNKTYDEVPKYLRDAFVAIEDERFYEHNGIDPHGILRAFVRGVTSGGFSEGGSTLTQQLIKNNIFPNFVEESTLYERLERKLQEQYLAVKLEKQMNKKEILEAYMNTINLGQNCLGVQTAAKRYFNKDVEDLTLSECSVIAGITKNPTGYDPTVYPEENAERRKTVLDKMLQLGSISQQEYDEAIADPVYDRIIINAPAEDTNPYSYFNDEIYEQVIYDLRTRLGYSPTQAYNALLSGGLTIVSTQDMAIQKICDEEVANEASYPANTEYGLDYALTITRANGSIENYSKEMLAAFITSMQPKDFPLVFSSTEEVQATIDSYKASLGIAEGDTVDEYVNITPQPQVSVVVMDQYTGKVKAIVGGRGEKTSSLSLDRATDSTRQPGSCFKILAAYAPAMDAYGYTLATSILDDGPFKYEGKDQYVNNYDFTYQGPLRVRYCIMQSKNVCAVKTITDIGPENAYRYLLNFGFTTLVDRDNTDYPGFTDVQQATALGGITRGVCNLEMTAAYAAIANHGTYIKPILYSKVLDKDGFVLLDNTEPDTHQVIKDSTAALLTSAMQDVINHGTGWDAKLNNMPAAGKTGTTEDATDLWLSGYTPYYTASVWGGYDSNKPMENMNQSFHKVIWKNIMNRIHENLERKDFTMPASIQRRSICSVTGLLATSSCTPLSEYFAEGTAPTQSCTGHQKEDEDEDKDDKDKDDDNDGEDDGEGGKTDNNGDTGTGGNTDNGGSGNNNNGNNGNGGSNNSGGNSNGGGSGNGGNDNSGNGNNDNGNSGGSVFVIPVQ